MSSKIRLDQLVLNKGLAESKSQAQALILTGKVLDHNGQPLTKAGHQVKEDAVISLKEQLHPWVSRGGIKLAHAIEEYAFNPSGQVIIDVGASTGGFTDVLLTNGAAKVYAVDVGYGQLHEKLRADERVVVMEKTNARHLTAEHITEPLDGIVCDASFISLKTVLPAAMELTKPKAWMLALIKPQFEVGKGKVGKGGVVDDPALHQEVCDGISHWLNQQSGWSVQGITQSPITGPKGNIEFIIYGRKSAH